MTIRSTERLERWLSIAVGIAAVAAVMVSLYQASLARAQLRASAWPYLTQSNGFVPGRPYTYTISNEGIGPARVRSFQVLLDGKTVGRWADVLRGTIGHGNPGLVYSSFHRGTVLPPGQGRTLITIPGGPDAAAFWAAAQTRIRTRVCFCSVYDECWLADSDRDDAEPVRACTEDDRSEFRN